jgi:hypothetical protein
MARAYSQDPRDRVIDAGTSVRAAAERIGIGVAMAGSRTFITYVGLLPGQLHLTNQT